MRILYLFAAVIFLLFHFSPGYAQVPFADTISCKVERQELCASACPPTSTVTGTCNGGMLKCCTRPTRVVQG
ncbi:UNVERIFIED_CONTAM: hypothetical protein K2H54_036469 [Gekko kuhli]